MKTEYPSVPLRSKSGKLNKTTSVTFRLSRLEKERLEKLAATRGVSMSKIVLDAIGLIK